jgi:transglutaminase-like putative cysteine protease
VINQSALTLGNVTWLTAAMAFVIAPHTSHLAWWVSAVCVAAGGWRWWIARHALRTPPWWVMALLAIAITIGAFLEYRRLFGREVGVMLLIAMLCLKMLEMRMKRDAMIVIFLGFFLALTNFLYSQTIAMGAYMLICVWLFIATLIGFNRIGTEPSIRERLVPSAWLLVQAIPMMIVFFFLFPRINGPLWMTPSEGAARTGLSESMAPGDISKLSQSDALAFRVEFDGPVPNSNDLYWRGPVLGLQVGKGWRMYESMPVDRIEYTPLSPAINYRVTLQPHGKNWLFALDVPNKIPPNSMVLPDYQLRSREPVSALRAYEMSSHLNYRIDAERSQSELARYLQYNPRINQRTIAFGKQMRERFPDPQTLIEELMRMYNREFTYTLEPPPLGENPMDEFLFDTKLGFCEHYAGSFALIMRAAGIPTRVVTGYQGGEVNPITRQLIVRQAEAHAWTEVWLPEQGWLRVDPTFAVSPLRINRGVNAALGPVGVFDTMADADKLGILRQMAYTWDAINSEWNRWVVGFNADRQRGLFEGLGMPDVDWRTLSIWLVVGIAVAGGGVGLIVLALAYRNRKPAVEAAFEAFCARIARQSASLARMPYEGPESYRQRLRREAPELADEAEPILFAYIQARYANNCDQQREANRNFVRLARRFRWGNFLP